jgi:hypothetical protein
MDGSSAGAAAVTAWRGKAHGSAAASGIGYDCLPD